MSRFWFLLNPRFYLTKTRKKESLYVRHKVRHKRGEEDSPPPPFCFTRVSHESVSNVEVFNKIEKLTFWR